MAGPTPVSALIHAATMVTAGVYLVARSNGIFAHAPRRAWWWRRSGRRRRSSPASIGLRQNDIKKVLAFSTVSQLGLMFLAVGSGAYVAGIFHLVTHAFFKAVLFLGAGSVIHAMHHAYHATHSHADAQDMRNMGGLRQWMPVTSTLMWIATLAIAGDPGVRRLLLQGRDPGVGVRARGGAAGVLPVLGARVAHVAPDGDLHGPAHGDDVHGPEPDRRGRTAALHEAPWVMTGPLAVLGAAQPRRRVINLPHFAGGHAWLEHWLEPVLKPSHEVAPLAMPEGSTEMALIAFAVLVGIVGLRAGRARGDEGPPWRRRPPRCPRPALRGS